MKSLHKHNSENGSVLGIIMIYFIVISLTSLAFFKLTGDTRIKVVNINHKSQNQYAVESAINLALWRINSIADTAGNFNYDSVYSSFHDSTMTLSVMTDRWGFHYNVSIVLDYDHAFNNMFYTTTMIDTSDPSINIFSSNNEFQLADSLPALDTTYYLANAVSIYNNGAIFNDTLTPGIHYIRGGDTELKNNSYLEGTLVVLGVLKVVGTNVHLKAGRDSSGAFLPALIVVDSVTTTDITNITVEGAIICYGHFALKNGTITGPFIGNDLEVQNSLTIDDGGSDQYYTYYPGLSSIDSSNTDLIINQGTWTQY